MVSRKCGRARGGGNVKTFQPIWEHRPPAVGGEEAEWAGPLGRCHRNGAADSCGALGVAGH